MKRIGMKSIGWAAAIALLPAAALAQPKPAAPAETVTWDKLPRMQLERQFGGPLQDTLIQRWRDPVDGTVCYIYLPISAQHSAPTTTGYVQYGPNVVGSISCAPGPVTPAAATAAPAAPAARPAAAATAPRPAKPPAAEPKAQ